MHILHLFGIFKKSIPSKWWSLYNKMCQKFRRKLHNSVKQGTRRIKCGFRMAESVWYFINEAVIFIVFKKTWTLDAVIKSQLPFGLPLLQSRVPKHTASLLPTESFFLHIVVTKQNNYFHPCRFKIVSHRLRTRTTECAYIGLPKMAAIAAILDERRRCVSKATFL
jgi:hypothetical protein